MLTPAAIGNTFSKHPNASTAKTVAVMGIWLDAAKKDIVPIIVVVR